MKTVEIILAVVTLLLMASTVICGFWIRSHSAGGVPDASSVSFHMNIAVATLVFMAATLVVAIIRR